MTHLVTLEGERNCWLNDVVRWCMQINSSLLVNLSFSFFYFLCTEKKEDFLINDSDVKNISGLVVYYNMVSEHLQRSISFTLAGWQAKKKTDLEEIGP